jgi:hypothetical protein
MNSRANALLPWAAPALAVLAALGCDSVEVRTFEVAAINGAKEPIQALILVDDQVVRAEDGKPVLAPAKVRLRFEADSSEQTGYGKVRLNVRAVVLDAQGNVSRGLEPRDSVPYKEESPQEVLVNDPPKKLFPLRLNPDYTPAN